MFLTKVAINIRYSCNQCEQQFIDKHSLKSHVASIHEEVKFNCNECDQQFIKNQMFLTKVAIMLEYFILDELNLPQCLYFCLRVVSHPQNRAIRTSVFPCMFWEN